MGRSVAQPITANELALALGATVIGDGSMQITSVSSLQFATPGDLTFFSDHKHQSAAIKSAASVMIVREADISLITCTRIIDATPHAAFARALDLLFPALPHVANVSSMAQLCALAQVAGARVDAFSSVGACSVVGAGSVIHSHVFIGDDVRIGEHCVIYPGASIMSGVQLGDRCIIHPGAVIGSDGFGFQPSVAGWQKVAQVGSVIVGSDVEIGANTTVDRGAIEDTVIGSGVKIDNLVQIAHNVKIGEHTAIAACAGIAGSTTVGARCMIGGAAMIVGHISICDDVIVSGGTLITNSIEQPGRYTGVFPSAEHREWAKIAATIRRSTKSRTK
jgi:UDP-3-O-[3-hydroxymyristoyl] glucosamine N-acyltransferase